MRLYTSLVFLALLGVHLPGSFAAEETKPDYAIREREAGTGTNLRRNIISSSKIPLNKRYHELSPEVRMELNKYYEMMDIGDEPPFPAEGLRPIYDAIAKAQAKLLVNGELILLVEVDSNGVAQEVKVMGSPKRGNDSVCWIGTAADEVQACGVWRAHLQDGISLPFQLQRQALMAASSCQSDAIFAFAPCAL
jgi:hypothetical protein